jgi:hypothetical protein
MTARTVMLSVDCPDDATFVNLFELLARHCAGLILDGHDARVFSHDVDEEAAE